MRRRRLSLGVAAFLLLTGCDPPPYLSLQNRTGERLVVVADDSALRVAPNHSIKFPYPGKSSKLFVLKGPTAWNYSRVPLSIEHVAGGVLPPQFVTLLRIDPAGEIVMLAPRDKEPLSPQPAGYPLLPQEK
jgi:hypothetical protein